MKPTQISALATFVASLKTYQLVELYNIAADRPVKKFENRQLAEARLIKFIGEWAVTPTEPDGYANFFGEFAGMTAKLGFELPVPIEEVEPEAVPRAAKGKQVTSPHLNLRCPACKFYAKTTSDMMALGRLICPVDAKHGMLLTAEERSETRGTNRGAGKKEAANG